MSMEPLFVAIAAVLKTLMRVMGWRVQVVGDQYLPADGPAVLASNHVSYLDPVLIGWMTQRRSRTPRFLAKQELFRHPILGPVMRRLKQVPVDRGGRGSVALGHAEQRLHAGDWVVVFPEGTISTSFVPAEARTGAARLAMAAGAPLYPVALWGGQRILTKGRPRNFERGVAWSVLVGRPIAYESGDDPADVTARLWQSVRSLVDQAQREYPQQPRDSADRWWQPRHLGGTAPSVEESAEQQRVERERRRAAASDDAGGRGRDPGDLR